MSFISNITGRILAVYEFRKRQLVYREYRDHFRNRLKKHKWNPEQPVNGEEEYLSVWKQLCSRVEPYSYRFFSHYMGASPYIVPEDIGRTYIEYYLNPLRYRDFYSDKNLYEQYLLPSTIFPQVYYRRICGGAILDANFAPPPANISIKSSAREFAAAMPHDKVVLKQTNNSGGGHGVLCLTRKGDGYFYSDKNELIYGDYLRNFASDWNIQELIEQHPFFAQFSKTSLNTIRLYIYRSVVNEEIFIYSASLRIGHNGSFVDNLSQGGGFVKIDIVTGKLIGKIYDEEGFEYESINDVDFSREYIIPQWDKIIALSKSIARQIRHCHMVALDLCIDNENRIRMIEHNIGDNSYWWSHFMQIQPFGDKIQEVINFCIEQKKYDPRFRYVKL